MSAVAKQIAAMLLKIGAVRLNPREPFTWSSGWKSPIYCDNRLTLSYPDIRTYIKNQFVELTKTHFPNAEGIAGVATAGLPQGALLADALNLPFVYVRSSAKAHGLGNQIEGKVTQGQKIVVLEDLVSTGGSSLKVVEALRDAGADVLGMVCIFNYGFDIAAQRFAEANVLLYPLCTYSNLVIEAVAKDFVEEDELASLQNWRSNPEMWGK